MSYELSPNVQYHTGIFNWTVNTGLMIAAGAALTAIAIGTLGVLHAHHILNIGPLNSLSTIWSFGIAGAGGVLLLADSITLFGLTQKHLTDKKIILEGSASIELRELDLQLSLMCCELKKQYTWVQPPYGVNGLFILLQNDEGAGSIHMFPDKLMYDEYVKDLEQNGYKMA